MQKQVIGVLFGNRGFFPDRLCAEGREKLLAVLKEFPVEVVALSESDSKFGSVENQADAKKAAGLLSARAGEIQGLILSLPNFGDEKSLASAVRLSGLKVPILVHAFPDDEAGMDITHRRDSFCGKISLCNNLRQFGLPFSLTKEHTVHPDSDDFRGEIARFLGVTAVVRGLRNLRVGVVGTRPGDFNTVRFSEKILERHGIAVEPLDLSEVLGRAAELSDQDRRVTDLVAGLGRLKAHDLPAGVLTRMARLGVVLNEWIAAEDLQATAIQCWSSLQQNYGVVPCVLMSLMSGALVPSACEADVMGVVSMMALQLASGTPSAILDWNNNYGKEPDQVVLFHCSNLPLSMLKEPALGYNAIIAGSVGRERAYGTVTGAMKPGTVTYSRVTTDDSQGVIRAYVGEGGLVQTPLTTFGGYGVLNVPRLNELMRYICREGFEHHVALTYAQVAAILAEAFEVYLGWPCYQHS